MTTPAAIKLRVPRRGRRWSVVATVLVAVPLSLLASRSCDRADEENDVSERALADEFAPTQTFDRARTATYLDEVGPLLDLRASSELLEQGIARQ